MRRNMVIFILAVVLLAVAFYFLVWRPQSNRIQVTGQQAKQEEDKARELRLEIDRLRALKERAPELRQQAAKLDEALPSDPQLANFILQVQASADAAGIDWLSVSPSPPAPVQGGAGAGQVPTNVLVSAVGLNVTGGYFQVQDFIVRLENLGRAVRIDTLSLGQGPDGLPQLAATLSMRMFVSAPQQAAPAPFTPPSE